jgi:hypothetical protein
MFCGRPMSGLSRGQRQAMARALERAADRFDERARGIDERVARWRKHRPDDASPMIAETLHGVAKDLRSWAARCLASQSR